MKVDGSVYLPLTDQITNVTVELGTIVGGNFQGYTPAKIQTLNPALAVNPPGGQTQSGTYTTTFIGTALPAGTHAISVIMNYTIPPATPFGARRNRSTTAVVSTAVVP